MEILKTSLNSEPRRVINASQGKNDYLETLRFAFDSRYINGTDRWTGDSATITLTDKLIMSLASNDFLSSQLVVDIGCGRGIDIERLLLAGFNTIGIDLISSTDWIAIEKKFKDSVKFIVSEFTEFCLSEVKQACAVLDNGSFHHQHPEHVSCYLNHIHSLLRPEGFLAMSLFAKDIKDKFDHSHGVLLELSDGRLSKLYDEREAHDLLKAHGFTNIRIQRVSRPDYVLDNLHVIAQRKKLE